MIVHSSFDQGVKPIGLPKRAFSRTWRLFGGSGGVRQLNLSLSLSLSTEKVKKRLCTSSILYYIQVRVTSYSR